MIRSLRWRLQLWHAVLLTTVLIIFGGVVYALQWETRLQQIDAELDRYASVLTSRLRGLFPVPRMQGPWPPRTPGRGSGPPATPESGTGPVDALVPANVPAWRSRDGWTGLRPPGRSDSGRSDSGRSDSGRSDSGRGDGRRDDAREGTRGLAAAGTEPRSREPATGSPPRASTGRDRGGRDPSGRSPWFDPPPGLGLPDEFRHLFEGDEQNSFYFTIWNSDGIVLEKSKGVGDIPFPDLHTAKDGLPVRAVRARDLQREVVHVSRFDINVLVGRNLKSDLAGLRRSGLLLGLTGLGVLAIGLAGGWWFSSRAIQPIAEMSATAESISVKNLSTRINVDSTAAELEQLAAVLNRTFDRLQSAFQRQGQFTADASHELRTPLSVILSHAELALARPRTGEEYQKAFQACRRASLRMKSLIDSLLLLARFDSRESEIERQPVQLDRLARDAVEMMQTLADERGILLHCQTEPVTVDGDPERLFQVLSNLLTNAIRYNRPDGRVDVEIAIEDHSAVIRVSDTGVGIAADDLPRIFDRFYRVDKARSHAEGGSGLGLAICQSIVETHGGSITATSQPGVGTTVEIRLPCRTDVAPSILEAAGSAH